MKQWTLLFVIAIHLEGCAGSGSSNWVAPEGIDAKQVKQAASQGNTEAQNNLGFLYAKGSGVPQDYVQAAKWYEKAAAQGLAEAQIRLGVLYDGGKSVPQDYAKARKWYEKAAPRGTRWRISTSDCCIETDMVCRGTLYVLICGSASPLHISAVTCRKRQQNFETESHHT